MATVDRREGTTRWGWRHGCWNTALAGRPDNKIAVGNRSDGLAGVACDGEKWYNSSMTDFGNGTDAERGFSLAS